MCCLDALQKGWNKLHVLHACVKNLLKNSKSKTNHRNAVEGSANTLCFDQLQRITITWSIYTVVQVNCLVYSCTEDTGASLASGEV
jgi:hypothetical protein